MLLAEEDQALGAVHCFSLAGGALFVEAIPQTDISRRITTFQYELVPVQGPGAHMYPYLNPASGTGPSLFYMLNLFCFIGQTTNFHSQSNLLLPHNKDLMYKYSI